MIWRFTKKTFIIIYRKKLEKVGEEEKTKLLVEKDSQIAKMNDIITKLKQELSQTDESLK